MGKNAKVVKKIWEEHEHPEIADPLRAEKAKRNNRKAPSAFGTHRTVVK